MDFATRNTEMSGVRKYMESTNLKTAKFKKITSLPCWVYQPDGLALIEFFNGIWKVIAFWNGERIVEFNGGEAK